MKKTPPPISLCHKLVYDVVKDFNAQNRPITIRVLAQVLYIPSATLWRVLKELQAFGAISKNSPYGYLAHKVELMEVDFSEWNIQDIIKANFKYSILMRAIEETARQNGTTLAQELFVIYNNYTKKDLLEELQKLNGER